MRDPFEPAHQRTVQWCTEQSRQGRHRFAVLDDHIGLQFGDVVDGLAANVVRTQAIDRQRDAAAAMPLDQPREALAVLRELVLDIGLVQPFFAQQVFL
ncbi:hypothetical protein D3C76_1611530 [compost metagenome]